MNNKPLLAAISYAPGPRDPQAIGLADRLNSEGVDCELDVYDGARPEGWARRLTDDLVDQRLNLTRLKEAHQTKSRWGLGGTPEDFRRHQIEWAVSVIGRGLRALNFPATSTIAKATATQYVQRVH